MKAMANVLSVLVAALGLAGCQWIPGTDEHRLTMGEKAAAALLRDPSSAQFRKTKVVHQQPSDEIKFSYTVCGEINGKNAHGAYAGFSRFVAAPEISEVALDPGLDISTETLDAATEECQSAISRARRTGFAEMAKYQCDVLKEKAADFDEQAKFEDTYAALCEASAK